MENFCLHEFVDIDNLDDFTIKNKLIWFSLETVYLKGHWDVFSVDHRLKSCVRFTAVALTALFDQEWMGYPWILKCGF